MPKRAATTTDVGYVNPRGQEVIRATDKPGTDFNQRIYVLRCRDCGNEYGTNGSNIYERRCPEHDGGAPSLEYQ